jgi:hypothetical protein
MDMLEICNSGMWPTEKVPPLCTPPSKGHSGSKCPGGHLCPPNGVCPTAEAGSSGDDLRTGVGTHAKPLHPEQSWAEYRR